MHILCYELHTNTLIDISINPYPNIISLRNTSKYFSYNTYSFMIFFSITNIHFGLYLLNDNTIINSNLINKLSLLLLL